MQPDEWRLDLGAHLVGDDAVQFRVWAPHANTVAVQLTGLGSLPVPMIPQPLGYHEVMVHGVRAGARYRYVLDGHKERPDPASRAQPEGVHGPSAVVAPHAFRWTDGGWHGLPLARLILYELHVGTATPTGTFSAIIDHLDYLRDDLGVTALELMPVAQFPGLRNWGYDGVCPFAPQSSYGGAQGLKNLVDACHAKGLAVTLDVVYNHLGPEGNYLEDYGPYFTDRYQTPWGRAINYDGPDSDEVRHYIISNAVYWVTEYHIDALRLDAIHGIYDFSARHILQELTDAVHTQAARLGRSILVIGESDLNDVRVIAPPDQGGHGMDGQWSDDCHHALHALLTGERAGYYEDFGHLDQLATALQEGFVYSGHRSMHRRRRHGNSARHRPPNQLVVYSQNHDQIGNRALGDRLSTLLPYAALKVAAAAVLLAPHTPMLFMGEEYGETAPFLYFIEHGDPALVDAVRQGRRKEFAAFGWKDVPDPQAPATFERSRVALGVPQDPHQAALLRWYVYLIRLRKTVPALGAAACPEHAHHVWAYTGEHVLALHRWTAQGPAALLLVGFNTAPTSVTLREPKGTWALRLDSNGTEFGGSGQAAAPGTLTIESEGLSVPLAPYTVALYVTRRT